MIKKFNIFVTIANNVLISKSLPHSISFAFDQQSTIVSQVHQDWNGNAKFRISTYNCEKKHTYELFDFIHRDLESGHVQPAGI